MTTGRLIRSGAERLTPGDSGAHLADADDVSEGAAAVLHLATAAIEDGGYYEGVAATLPNTLMNDHSSVDRLWKLSARLVGLAA